MLPERDSRLASEGNHVIREAVPLFEATVGRDHDRALYLCEWMFELVFGFYQRILMDVDVVTDYGSRYEGRVGYLR